MIKAMIFIDGTWLYANIPNLRTAYGREDFHVDFGKLPKVLAEEISRQMKGEKVDVVRTHLFGSYAANYDLKDEESVQRRKDFFTLLKEEHHYELHLYAVNYLGRRLRRGDRGEEDAFEPKEKCVDISLATTMLYQAAVPHAYDIAVAVVGDRDFSPVLQHVRLLGKRVAIASVKGSCAAEFADLTDPARIKDFDIIWLDDLLDDLELKFEPVRLRCESPMHRGRREAWTTFHPRKGQKFYCDECRSQFSRQKQQAEEEFVGHHESAPAYADGPINDYGSVRRSGLVTKVFPDRGFGFLQTEDAASYFFHFTDLDGIDFEQIREGMAMQFEVKTLPQHGKAGAAQNIRRSG